MPLCKPLHDNVLVKIIAPQTQGIILVQNPNWRSDFEQNIGIVVSVGNEVSEVKENDKVLLCPFDPLVRVDTEDDYIMVKEGDIEAIFEAA